MTGPTVGGDDGGPWLTVSVLATNPTTSTQNSPHFEIDCAGDTTSGESQTTSTYNQSMSLSAGSSQDGTINLLLPGDDRAHAPRPTCVVPAVLMANGSSGERLTWAIADDIVAAMNAAPQPAAVATVTTIFGPGATEVRGDEV